MEGQKLTIIKKKGKGGGAGHHGGSWKVAFADFMTAMMAFFLLMWLLSMGPQKKKEDLANYFKTFSLFGEGGVATSSVSLSDQAGGPPQVSQASSKKTSDTEGEEGGGAGDQEGTDAAMEEMKAKLEREIQERLTDVKDQIVIGRFDGGLKIDIMDKEGLPMFELGSTELTAKAKKILLVVADNIKQSTQKLEIEGHTDAVGYSGKQQYGNWELSTARASAARIELEKDGISSALLVRVSGYADTEPIIKENPFDPRNRRISLRLLYPKQAQGTPGPAEGAPPIQPSVVPSQPSIVPPLGANPAPEAKGRQSE